MSEKLIKKHLDKATWLIKEGFKNNEKAAQTNLTKAVYELDKSSEILRKVISENEQNELANIINESASGTVEIIGNDWLHLRLEMLLPSDKNLTEVKKLSNTVTNLLDCHAGYLGYLPQYERAFVAIVEHRNVDNLTSMGAAFVFDHDNKGYRAIPNALKGRVFADDNQFTMSLGLFSVLDENDGRSCPQPHCDIYVVPFEEIVDFSAHFLNF